LSHWKSDPSAPGGGWTALKGEVEQAIARLERQKAAGEIPDFEVAGFIWMQGEGDSNGWGGRNPHQTYAARFETLVGAVRELTGEANLPVVLGRISSQLSPSVTRDTGVYRFGTTFAEENPDVVQAHTPNQVKPDFADFINYVDDKLEKRGPVTLEERLQTVRDQQVQFADSDPLAAWVDTDDLELRDPWHFDSAGHRALGERFGAEWLAIPEPGSVAMLLVPAVLLALRRGR